MDKHTPLAVVILAAGKGTRMRSDKPKVMHELLGLPMISWLLSSVEKLSPEHIIVVIGENMDDLSAAVHPYKTAIQVTQNGTGSALKAAMPLLEDFEGDLLVLLGDTPLISASTLHHLIDARHQDSATGLSVLGTYLDDPTGYGRLLMDENGDLKAIREEKDASDDEKAVNIVNTGAFCLDARRVKRWLDHLDNSNAQQEYYITDLPEIAARETIKTRVFVTDDSAEVTGCNMRIDLSILEQHAQQKMREMLINDGVIMQDPASVYLHHDTKIEPGTMIEPHVYFGPDVTVGKNVHIKAFCHFEGANIGDNTTVGPFARLRPGSDIGEDVRIGNFVEIKQSKIGNRSKISHLGYVGDCIMGEDVNFSCGAITVNYDGFEKHQTTIEKGTMVGSNVTLVAPVTVGAEAFVAAGSTITTDIPPNALAIARETAKIRPDWATHYRKHKTKKQ